MPSKLVCIMYIYYNKLGFKEKNTDYTTLSRNPNINCALWVTMICQHDCNKCATSVGSLHGRRRKQAPFV